MSQSLLAALPLAFVLGMKHALEVDHVVAVRVGNALQAGRYGRWATRRLYF